jgi:tRNA threonylcarbamoyladenosine biosynthesis protein TsaB
MKILAIDTASAYCSAALYCDSAVIVREADSARTHVQLILPMVDSLLAEASMTLRQLDGIAFGRGPGSFTGVRIAAAVTQGLAFGADLPVLPISDLRALAAQALRRLAVLGESAVEGQVLACMDARMGEVYSGVFRVGLETGVSPLHEEQVGSPDAVTLDPSLQLLAAIGMGLGAYPKLMHGLSLPTGQVFASAEPHAWDVLQLAVSNLQAGASWQDATAAQPVYLRNNVVKAPA